MMATSSLDGTIKVWDIAANGGSKPQHVGTRHMKNGELFSMQFSQDIPWVLACGGNTGEIGVWDISESVDIENHFKPFLQPGTYSLDDYNPDAVYEEEPAEDADDYESMEDEKPEPTIA